MVPQLDEITHTWGIVSHEFRDVRLGADGPLKGLPELVEVGSFVGIPRNTDGRRQMYRIPRFAWIRNEVASESRSATCGNGLRLLPRLSRLSPPAFTSATIASTRSTTRAATFSQTTTSSLHEWRAWITAALSTVRVRAAASNISQPWRRMRATAGLAEPTVSVIAATKPALGLVRSRSIDSGVRIRKVTSSL
jgi:hypothetical protein